MSETFFLMSQKGSGGDYTIVSGVRAHAGAKGASKFAAVEDPWKNADICEGTISLKLSSKP
jgi:hypothetical protein